jgi:hypothetical protein
LETCNQPKAKNTNVINDAECFYCHDKGHWNKNCPNFLKKKNAGKVLASSLDIFVIEINLATSFNDWVLDTGSCARIYSNRNALSAITMLSKGEVQLRVGNGASVAVVVIGCVKLHLPSGLVIKLNDVYFVPSISKNIISISCLDMDGYDFIIKNKCCSIYRDGIFYGSSLVKNGLYLLDMEKPVYNINNKRLNISHKSMTQMWYHRLGHINESRIKKLQEAGLLGDIDFESLDTCESYLVGKMTKAPFTGQCERASDLLGFIHSDVCGPMSTCARGGFRYFITFTDDLSRYGYVYLMKHKSESFEKFKEFKNEVEN